MLTLGVNIEPQLTEMADVVLCRTFILPIISAQALVKIMRSQAPGEGWTAGLAGKRESGHVQASSCKHSLSQLIVNATSIQHLFSCSLLLLDT